MDGGEAGKSCRVAKAVAGLGDDARLDLVTDEQMATEQIPSDLQRGSIKECCCENPIAV